MPGSTFPETVSGTAIAPHPGPWRRGRVRDRRRFPRRPARTGADPGGPRHGTGAESGTAYARRSGRRPPTRRPPTRRPPTRRPPTRRPPTRRLPTRRPTGPRRPVRRRPGRAHRRGPASAGTAARTPATGTRAPEGPLLPDCPLGPPAQGRTPGGRAPRTAAAAAPGERGSGSGTFRQLCAPARASAPRGSPRPAPSHSVGGPHRRRCGHDRLRTGRIRTVGRARRCFPGREWGPALMEAGSSRSARQTIGSTRGGG